MSSARIGFGLTAVALAMLAGVDQAASDVAPPAAMQRFADSDADYRRGVEALHAGEVERAEAAALAMLAAMPTDASGRHLMGLVKTRKGDLAGAVAEFDKALSNNPQSIAARTERAVVLARMGQLDKARADLETLKSRAAACAKTCSPELKAAISRIEAALAAGRTTARLAVRA